MKLIQKLGPEMYCGEMRVVSLFLCPVCNRTVKKRHDKGQTQKTCGGRCRAKAGPPITDFDRLNVVYHFVNRTDISERSLSEITGISKHRIQKILTEHLNGKNRVEWVEIESRINFEQDKQTA